MVVHTAVRVFRKCVDFSHSHGGQMLGNLKEPPSPFEDIISTHFRLKAKAISEQLDRWAQLDKGHGGASVPKNLEPFGEGASVSVDQMQSDVKELKQLLAEL